MASLPFYWILGGKILSCSILIIQYRCISQEAYVCLIGKIDTITLIMGFQEILNKCFKFELLKL